MDKLYELCKLSTETKLQKMYVAELEKILGVPRQTLYGWERAGKIPEAHRDPMSNYRYWFQDEVDKLKKITGRG